MIIENIDIYNLKIPFVRPITHNLFTRTATESLVVTLADGNGNRGVGEGTPREYVTGETLADSLRAAHTIASSLPATPLPTFRALIAWLHAAGPPDVMRSHPAAFCAIETALLDLWSRRQQIPLFRLFHSGDTPGELIYSGVIPGAANEKEFLTYVSIVRQLRLASIKIKVSEPESGIAQLKRIRNALGWEIDVRVDANAAFGAATAIRFAERANRYQVRAIEQPVAKNDLPGLKQVSDNSDIPIVADESMYTTEGPFFLIENKICHGLNIRLSSCGGFLRARQIHRRARSAGMLTMLGAHVGETAILSLAGRNLAVMLPSARYLEGSFSRYILKEDLTEEEIAFGPGGAAPIPQRPGLGIDVSNRAIAAWSD